ncbi:uncharacterized protein B0H64DRAFT_160261 [Chaetomium fimeti]|uniref:PXA domain-containing protein n=1 Tax=Chaetomium fimeti TaxID=1854472 RepID=A0AAE0HG59_9PEZI|nr:hypothetical protein B0H64DRAFT_160261 [Chaetomium fimeti]
MGRRPSSQRFFNTDTDRRDEAFPFSVGGVLENRMTCHIMRHGPFPRYASGPAWMSRIMLLSHGIQRHVLDAANLPPLLRTVRGALFPNNMPAGKPTLVAPSSDAELRELRRRCASAIWALVPKGMGRLYFGGGLLRANSNSRASSVKTEGSAELKTAVGRGMGRDKGPLSSSSSKVDEAKEKARLIQTAPAQTKEARGQGRPRSGSPSQSRSRRSAPAPRPKTGGQGSAAASADPPSPPAPPPPSPLPKTASASEEATGGMASTGPLTQAREGGSRQDRDYDGADDEEILVEIERGILDVFSDAYCNRHLVYGILELVLARLLPELTEKGVLELWAERLSVDGS